jgi:EpsI family protein
MKIVVIAILAAFTAAGNYLRTSEAPAAGALGLENVRLDSGATGSSGGYVEEAMDDGFLETLSAREVVFRTYQTGAGDPVWIFMGHFDRQKEGSQVHSPKHCYPGSGWNIVDERAVPAPWGDGEVRSLEVTDGNERRLVFYWFQTTSGYLTGVLPLKLYLTKNAVMRRSQDVVFIRISTVIDNGRGDAAERLGPFAVAVRGEVESMYRKRNETG